MAEIEFQSRAEMVRALLTYRAKGATPEVIDNGRTLRVPDSLFDEGSSEGLEGLAELESEQDALHHAVAHNTITRDDEEEEEGSLLGVVTPEDDEEDLIGQPPPALEQEVVAFVESSSVDEIRDAVEAGMFTAEDAVAAERQIKGTKARKGVLALTTQED